MANEETARKARLTAALFRVLYLFSASVEDVLPNLKLVRAGDGHLILKLPKNLQPLMGEKPKSRIEQLSKEIGEEISMGSLSEQFRYFFF